MADLQGALGPFVALIIVVLIGMWTKARAIVTAHGQAELTRFILDLGLPALVFYSMASGMTRDMLLQAPLVILAAALIIALGYALARGCVRALGLQGPHARILEMEAAFPNTGFLGIPVNALLFGAPGAFLAVLFDLGLTILMYGFPAWILDRERAVANRRGMFVNGITIGFALGLVPALTGWPMPSLLLEPIRMIGQMSIPLGLLLVGIMAVPINVKKQQTGVIGWVALLRLGLVPLLVWAAVKLLHVPQPAASVIILEAAMPAFAGGPIMAQKHGGDHQLAASATVVTTLLSALTLPILALLLSG